MKHDDAPRFDLRNDLIGNGGAVAATPVIRASRKGDYLIA
jgi:hypothetical protein